MNEWALLKGGKVINVVTTQCSRTQVEQAHPGYVVRDLYSLPSNIQEAYQYWNERP